jgi:DUF1680 family protein
MRIAAVLLAASTALAQQGPLREVPFTQVKITGGFWAQRQQANRDKTVWANLDQCEQTGRNANFDLAAGKMRGQDIKPDQFNGYFFNDSDVYKAIEGASYILATDPDPKLDAALDRLIARIAAAQQPDGYLNTYYTIVEGLDNRFTDLRNKHELYCAGHLIEAGIAHKAATGKTPLFDVAVRYADLLDATFGPAKRHEVCGHPEVELALIRLSKATGQDKYLRLAEWFVDQHGKTGEGGHEPYGDYFQDYVPIADMDENKGHAVRAMYLYCAATDIASLTGNKGYTEALGRLWDDLTLKKMYITGGIGSNPNIEGFGAPYDLPNQSAYAETCAGIGLAMWAHRMNLLHADAKYIDVMERVLYNGIASGVSLSGDHFFYDNPLESDGNHHRPDWYACACCPPSILRLMASLGSYIYAQTDDTLYVNLFVDSEADITLGGQKVHISVKTDYPWSEAVSLKLKPEKPATFKLFVRVPDWCETSTIQRGDQKGPMRPTNGYWLVADTEWRRDARFSNVELNLPMPVNRIRANPQLGADRGRTALQRGPILYALEGADNKTDPRRIALPPDAELTAKSEPGLLGGVTIIRGRGLAAPKSNWSDTLYAPSTEPDEVEFTAIPYFAWDNREPGPMTVWLPESPGLMDSALDTTISATASHCYEGDSPTALFDGREPKSSADQEVPRFTWWPQQGSTEWAQLDFARPRRIRSVQVYWFSDVPRGGCAAPKAWRLLYKDGDAWKPVPNPTATGTTLDQYNKVTFDTIKTTALRLEADLADGKSAGILEWKAN